MNNYLILGAFLFAISIAGIIINRKNIIMILLSIELMLLSTNFNFIAFSTLTGKLSGQIYVFFILTVAAVESAVGLTLIVALFKKKQSIAMDAVLLKDN